MKFEIIHIGFSKSASTYLQSIFEATPGFIYHYKSGKYNLNDENIETVSEAYNDQIILESDEHIILPEWHPKLHRVRVTQIPSIKPSFEYIKRKSNNSKIILVIRSQYQLIVSRYSQFIVGSGGKLSFQEFFDEMLNEEENFYENYYHRIISLLHEIFGRDNVKTLIYEELKHNEEKFIAELSTFTEIPFKYSPAKFKSIRKGLTKRGLTWVKNLNKLLVPKSQPEKSKVRTFVPRLFYASLIRAIRLFDGYFPGEKLKLTEKQEKKISRTFSLDNQLLEELLNKDLSPLGYK